MSPHILVVDNEQPMCEIIKQSLQLEKFSVKTANSGQDAISILGQESFDVVVTDLKMQNVDGLQLLRYVKENSPSTEIILITAYASQETALEAMKSGAYDYLIKPFNMDELILRIKRIISQNEIIRENEKLKSLSSHPVSLSGIIGKSKKMRAVFDLVKRVSGQDASVLIRGESGTGKELVARAIHNHSGRNKARMVTVNCAALPENLLESELFGYEKGAFTGASQTKKGMFELADGGTLFLDEIGDLSMSLQAKLLRVLQNREIIHLGGHETIRVDVRLITATHRNLEQMIDDQMFRSDLYYRINLFPINLPPLRQRKEDIPELIEYFMSNYPDKILSSQAKRTLMEYDFPGNVRELENIISREAIVADKFIEAIELPKADAVKMKEDETGFAVLPQDGTDLDALIKSVIEQALKRAGGNKSKAADLLHITRRRLYSLMETHKIH